MCWLINQAKPQFPSGSSGRKLQRRGWAGDRAAGAVSRALAQPETIQERDEARLRPEIVEPGMHIDPGETSIPCIEGLLEKVQGALPVSHSGTERRLVDSRLGALLEQGAGRLRTEVLY